MIRELRVRDTNGRPLARGRLTLVGSKGERAVVETDADGRARLDWDGDWVDRVEIDGEVVKRDWSLSGLFGPKSDVELEVPSATSGQGSERLLLLRYPDRRPVAKRQVKIHGRGEEFEGQTDESGRLRFPWAGDYIERVEVEQLAVKRDWSISGLFGPQRELELEVPRFDALRDQDRDALSRADRDYTQAGVRGRLYYADGTQVREAFKVSVSLQGSQEVYHTEQAPSYCRDDGEFYISTPDYAKDDTVRRMWIKGDEIPKSRWIHTKDAGRYVVLVPDGWRRGGGDAGGVVAGQVVERDGSPAVRCKVQGVVVASSFLSFQRPQSETYTDDQGRFVLVFSGGIELKHLYVDGNEPLAISVGEGSQARRISAQSIRAGTFGLKVVRQARF